MTLRPNSSVSCTMAGCDGTCGICSPRRAETLVEALERAGVGTYSAEYRGMVARDADPIFKTLARFASPEVKREVLRALILDHPDAVEDNGRVTIEVPRGIEYRSEVTLTYLANWLAPSLAPLEAP